jgi:anthranilate phosphoribosyltransferase
MEGDATPAQIGGFLMALRTRGETSTNRRRRHGDAGEMPARARARGRDRHRRHRRRRQGHAQHLHRRRLRGGRRGRPVAKHGNRNLSSKSGAADALTELGVNVMVGPEVVERALPRSASAS